MGADLELYRKSLKARCQPIHGHGFPSCSAELDRLAAYSSDRDGVQDVYGEGALIEGFEKKLRTLFGHEAARFLPSGTMAQGIAMRIWCGPGGRFGMHPTCHLELHEERGYSHLFGLQASLLGPPERALLPEDLVAAAEPLGALIVELPTRENGGCLPCFEELEELCALGRGRGIKMHLDGARVWEAQAALDVPFVALGALFDSIYVSFYKGIGALSGAMLLGPQTFIDQARLWQRRQGGNLFTLWPNVVSAASRFDEQLERFPAYRQRARSLGEALRNLPGLNILPEDPRTNMMHVLLDLNPELALPARDRVAEESGLWLFSGLRKTNTPNHSRFELYVGEAAMRVPDADIVAGFREVLNA